MTDKAQLIEQFKKLGVKSGMTLLVHSSLRRVGKVDGGADTVIDALLEVLGENGTLLMSGVSGNVNPEQPVYHVKYTPATVGTLVNVFMKRDNVVRSLHPVHSVAGCGPRAKFITDGHLEANTPWSPDSPYGKLMREENVSAYVSWDNSETFSMRERSKPFERDTKHLKFALKNQKSQLKNMS